MALIKLLSRAVVIGVGLVAVSPIQTASACSPPVCFPQALAPRGGSVPSNLPAIRWTPGLRAEADGGLPEETQSDELTITCTLDSASRVVSFHVELEPIAIGDPKAKLIRFDQPLAAGETCVISTVCQVDGEAVSLTEATYTITEAAPLPSGYLIGALALSDVHWRNVPRPSTEPGQCGTQDVLECGALLSLTLDEQLAPWADALVYQLNDYDERVEIDGPSVWLRDNGRTDARELTIEAWLPGTAGELSSTSVVAPILCSSSSDGGTDEDAGLSLDGGISIDASNIDPGFGRVDDGCSCSVAGPRVTHSFAWLWSLAVIGLLAARRARAQQARKILVHA